METEAEIGGHVSISQGVPATRSCQEPGGARKEPLPDSQRKQGSADFWFLRLGDGPFLSQCLWTFLKAVSSMWVARTPNPPQMKGSFWRAGADHLHIPGEIPHSGDICKVSGHFWLSQLGVGWGEG